MELPLTKKKADIQEYCLLKTINKFGDEMTAKYFPTSKSFENMVYHRRYNFLNKYMT